MSNFSDGSSGDGGSRVGSAGDIHVLTDKDGDGREIKDAKFVEIMKSARNRIKSAASLGECYMYYTKAFICFKRQK